MPSDATTAPAVPSPMVASEASFFELSRLMVVAIDSGSNSLCYIAQTAPNGGWETHWSPIDTTHSYSVMTAGQARDGSVAVVAQISGKGSVVYIDEAMNQPDGVERWNSPVDLGLPSAGMTMQSLSMARDADGRVEIFAVDSTGSIWWIFQNPDQIVDKQVTVTPPGTDTPIVVTVQEMVPPTAPWSGWAQIPGGLSSIVACRQGDGRVALFGINSAGNAWRCVQTKAQALVPADWSGWTQIDNNSTGTVAALSPVLDAYGALNLFTLTTGGQVVHMRQQPAASDSWTPWATNGYSRIGVTSLAAGIQGDGDIILVACDQAKVLSANAQLDVATQRWSGWNDFSYSDWPTQVALDYNADGRLSLFSHWLLPQNIGIGGLWTLNQVAVDSSEWEIGWTNLAPGGIVQFAVVRDLTPPSA